MPVGSAAHQQVHERESDHVHEPVPAEAKRAQLEEDRNYAMEWNLKHLES
jgi:hypothetical protein